MCRAIPTKGILGVEITWWLRVLRLHSLGTSLGGVDLWSVASLVLVRRCAVAAAHARTDTTAVHRSAVPAAPHLESVQHSSRCELFESSDQSRDGIINQTPQRLPRTQLAIRYISGTPLPPGRRLWVVRLQDEKRQNPANFLVLPF